MNSLVGASLFLQTVARADGLSVNLGTGGSSSSGSNSNSSSSSSNPNISSILNNINPSSNSGSSGNGGNSNSGNNSSSNGSSSSSGSSGPTAGVDNATSDPSSGNTDRKKGADTAAMMGMMGAAIAGMSCMMMMREAQKTGDKMMMMMAMQQCSQAAQSAANAAQNKDAGNSITQKDSPKTPSLASNGGFQTPNSTDGNPDPTYTVAQPTDNSPTDPETPTPQSPNPSDGAAKPKSDTKTSTVTAGQKPVDAGTVPGAIPKANLGFDEKSNGGGTTPDLGNGQYGGMGGNGTGQPLTPAQAAALGLDGLAGDGTGRRINKGAQDGSADGGGGGGSDGGGEGKSNFDLAALFGAPPGPADIPYGAGSDIVVLPEKKDGAKTAPNIFEFASYRYKSAAFNEGKIRTMAPFKKAGDARASLEKRDDSILAGMGH